MHGLEALIPALALIGMGYCWAKDMVNDGD